MQITVRAARFDDCAELAEIHQQSLDMRDSSMETNTSPERFSSFLDTMHEREALLVLEEEGKPVGWGTLKRWSDRPGYAVACETSIYLRRDLTGRGWGSQLQEALLDRARQLQYRHVAARIWAANERSLNFHYKFGYTLVGIQREVGYLDGAWHDVAILQLLL